MNEKLILASSSPRRADLLRSACIEFRTVHPRDVDESHLNGEVPGDYAIRVSLDKAFSVLGDTSEENIIISADTIVTLEEKIFGKPQNEAEAFRTLSTLSSRTHDVITAFSIINGKGTLLHQDFVRTHVTFKSLAPAEIRGYIKTGEPMDKAGSYAIQGAGAFMIDKINGSYTNVVGLPLSNLVDILNKLDTIGTFRNQW